MKKKTRVVPAEMENERIRALYETLILKIKFHCSTSEIDPVMQIAALLEVKKQVEKEIFNLDLDFDLDTDKPIINPEFIEKKIN